MATAAPQPSGKPIRGIVKSVLSGDTLIIQDVDKPNAQEKQVTLSSVTAPRLGRPKFENSEAVEDENFAWESREFLRKKCIGKKVVYRVEFTNKSGRDYVTVHLVDANDTLNKIVVTEGWASVNASVSDKKPELADLVQLQEAAIAAGKGLHNKNTVGAKRATPNVEGLALSNQLKGKPLAAVVEQVRTGTTLRVTILPSHHNVIVLLSGAQAPGFKRKDDGSQDAEPFAKEARAFVEQNALQRDVTLTIEGFDKQNTFFGSVECNGRDIAEELLKNGFATYNGRSAASRGAAWVEKLKAAEKSAKDARKRKWANYVEKGESGPIGSAKEFTGKVTGIIHAGTISVAPDNGGPEQTINFAGIKAPSGVVKEPEGADDATREAIRAEKAYSVEAKEWLRKKIIGKSVRVVFDYVRKAANVNNIALAEKTFHTVYVNENANVAVLLVEQGLAKTQNYGPNADRPADYELFIIAEEKAKKNHRNWHGPASKAPSRRVNDLSVEDKDPKQRAKQVKKAVEFLPHIQRNGPHKAVVDYVFSGGRYKVTIPQQSCTIALSLSGVKVPKRGDSAESDVLSNEALQWARSKINQRDVIIDVEAVDKGGNFMGDVLIGKDNSFAVQLVAEGFASVHGPTAERMRNGQQLFEAEAKAKKARKNIWKNYDAEEEARKAAAVSAENAELGGTPTSGQEYLEVVVTEVLKGDRFFFQIVNAESASLDDMVRSLTELSIAEGAIPHISPKVGEVVRAQFTDDDQWYRAKVVSVLPDGNYNVIYFDYGNSEVVGPNRIRAIPHGFSTLPVQANEAGLAFIRAPSLESEWGRESQAALRDLVGGGRHLIASVEYRDNGMMFLTLADREAGLHVNAAMIRSGVARMNRRLRRQFSNPTYVKLKEEEEKAKSSHTGMWQYGDAPDSDEDEDEPRGAWGKPAAKPAADKAAAPAAAPKKK